MISAWWLALIIPASGSLGVVVAALCFAAKRGDETVCCGHCHRSPGKERIPCANCPAHGHLADQIGFAIEGDHRPWADENRGAV